MEIVVNRNSEDPAAVVSGDLTIINLNLIPKGKFRTLLRKSLGDKELDTFQEGGGFSEEGIFD